MSEDKEISDVMKEEQSRGRRPIDTTARAKAKKLREDIGKVLRFGDERALVRILHEAGHPEQSAEFQNALKLFRQFSGQR